MTLLKNNLYPRRRKPWTKLEDLQLRLFYPKYPNSWLAREFGRTPPAISGRAGRCGLKKDVSKGYQPPLREQRLWTDKEFNFLRKHYKTMAASDIAAVIGRSCDSVHTTAVCLGLKKIKLWTAGEDKRFRQLYQKYSFKELTKEFNRSKRTLYLHAKKIKLPRKAFPLSKYTWSREEIKYLIKNYHLMSRRQLAKHVKHSACGVQGKARELGLRSGMYWTEKQKQYLKRWYYKKPLKEIAKSLGRGLYAVQEYAPSLGLYQRHWSRQEIDKLTRLYGKGLTVVEIARRLNRSYNSANSMLYVVGLKQTRPR